MIKRAIITIGHIVDYQQVPSDSVEQLARGITLQPDAARDNFLSDLQFTISSYASDVVADKSRVVEIKKALRGDDPMGSLVANSMHSWAATIWLNKHGGKKLDLLKARIKFNKTVSQGAPPRYAKTILALSLARLLKKYSTESISTSRYNGHAETRDGALAILFNGALEIHREKIADPFPYLKIAVGNTAR